LRLEWEPVELRGKLGRRLDLGVGEVAVLGTLYAGLEVKSGGDVAVGLSIAETAASVTVGLSNAGTGALAGRERAAALLALGIALAGLEDGQRASLRRRGLGSVGGRGLLRARGLGP